jgi:hypothetical protein
MNVGLQFLCLLVLLFPLENSFAETEKPASKPEVRNLTNPTPKATIEPEVKIPPLALKMSSQSDFEELDPQKYRFSLYFMMGTWNRRSFEITQIINPHLAKLKRRHVFIAGAFSHDTAITLRKWEKEAKPLFTTGLVHSDFIDALQNPKVPTFWLINAKGNILQRKEQPTNEDIEEIIRTLFRWTEF